MKIAIFSETFLPKIDGVVKTVCNLLDHLKKTNHKSVMYAPKGGPSRYAKTPVLGLPSYPCPFYPDLKLVPPIFNVMDTLEKFDPDVIHLINPFSLGLVGLHHARQLEVPVVASYHTDIPGYTEKYGVRMFKEFSWSYLRWIHNNADLNLCPSYATQAELLDKGFERLKIWGRGIDTDRFNPKKRNMVWRNILTDGHPEDPLLLYIGRIGKEKRIDFIRPLLDEIPDIRFAVVGNGPERENIEELFEGTNTVFTGFLTGEDLAHAYPSGDVFVFPATNETFGNVVLEAMASGLPVVTANAGGQTDLVREGYNGYLFEPTDRDALKKAIITLINNKELAAQMGQNGRTRAKQHNWKNIMNGLINDYISVTEPKLITQIA